MQALRNEPENRTKFVVGLGNPGRRYAGTRHNVGFRVVSALGGRWQAGGPREAFSGRLYDVRVARSGAAARRVMLLTPQTYMNCSGRAVGEMVAFYKAPHEDVLVVLDDLALPLGRLRMRAEGTAGGHNGLTDVLNALGAGDVPRLRVGIGPGPPEMDSADFVLGRFSPDEAETIAPAIERACDAVEDWVFHGTAHVMNAYNSTEQD